MGVKTLTLYAFSSDNWKRPSEEVNALMRLFGNYLRRERAKCVENGIRVSVIGRRDRLPLLLIPEIEATEEATLRGTNLHLRIAVDYSSRDAILAAARMGSPTREGFSSLLGPDVDLLIRTGGEQRLSDFMLWECAYAEFHFTHRMWPDFQAGDLKAALDDFRMRQRRFGAVPERPAAAV
jgi:undecaprenyl diphosphate synthase